jgi:GTP cyclohydrolase I
MNFDHTEADLRQFLIERFCRKYSCDNFEAVFGAYKEITEFDLNQNVFSVSENFNDELLYMARLVTQYYLTLAFKAMKVNLDDANTTEALEEGNIGTPGRLAKMWTASGLDDSTELLAGRWTKPPRMASFPNTHKQKIPITKRIDLVSCCSHHIAPFSSFFREDAYAVVSYIPDEKVLGISKLQRVVDWIARRGWLQEDLTKEIFEEVAKVAETESVYVKLCNISHTCESLRGAQAKDGAFTTEYYGGEFNDPEVRKQI